MMSRFIFTCIHFLIKEAEDWYLNPPVNFWQDFSQKHRQIHDILNRASTEEDDFQSLNTSEDEFRRAFQHVNPNKATGPDNIAPRVLKLLKGPKGSLFVQRNIENQPNYERLVHNMTFKSNKMSLPWK